jgi:hypothetical protein
MNLAESGPNQGGKLMKRHTSTSTFKVDLISRNIF